MPPGAVANEAKAAPGKERAASGFYTTAPHPSKVPFSEGYKHNCPVSTNVFLNWFTLFIIFQVFYTEN